MGQGRMLFVDNIRLSMIVLVLLDHAAVTYSRVGGWYFRDPVPPGPYSLLGLLLVEGYCQSFFMGLLFALAGYYAALSLDRKGVRAFVAGRLARLGPPILVYMAVVNPLTVYYLAGIPALAEVGFRAYYRSYLTTGGILSGSGPMWFALALLLFCLVLAALAAIAPGTARPRAPRRPTGRMLLWLALTCAAGTFLVRLVAPVGTTVFNMQPAYFPQYVTLFVFGVAAWANDWLVSIDIRLGRACLRTALAGAPIWAGLLLLTAGDDPAALSGGLHWSSAAVAAWESLTAMCMTAGLIATARETWNAQGRLVAAMSDGAFAVYVFHPPIMVALARVLTPLEAPALAKCLVLFAVSVPVCFGTARILRRLPLLRDLTRQ